MSSKLSINLTGVPETLLMPLWGRAKNTQSARPILRDATAVELVERLDFDFSRIASKMSAYSSLYWARRALLLDGIVRAFLHRHPQGVVVNVGAGLDTTFQRIDNGAVRWFDLDLPDVIAVRRALLPEGPRNRLISGSLLDDDWLATFTPGEPILLLFGGVLFYFDEATLRGLFGRIASRLPGVELAFDVLSGVGAHFTTRYMRRVGLPNAPILWTTRSPDPVRTWVPRLEVLKVWPLFEGMEADPAWSLGLRGMIWLTDRIPIGQLYQLRLG